MANKNEKKRGFVQFSRAWYNTKAVKGNYTFVDQITIGLYNDGGQIGGDIQVSWYSVNGCVVPKLECFDDAWENLVFFEELLKAMAGVDNQSVSPQGFREILLSCGFEDRTQTSPNDGEVTS